MVSESHRSRPASELWVLGRDERPGCAVLCGPETLDRGRQEGGIRVAQGVPVASVSCLFAL